jgi:hypothetical protein
VNMVMSVSSSIKDVINIYQMSECYFLKKVPISCVTTYTYMQSHVSLLAKVMLSLQ